MVRYSSHGLNNEPKINFLDGLLSKGLDHLITDHLKSNFWSPLVVYFDLLLGAERTWKLVETLFQPFSTFFLYLAGKLSLFIEDWVSMLDLAFTTSLSLIFVLLLNHFAFLFFDI